MKVSPCNLRLTHSHFEEVAVGTIGKFGGREDVVIDRPELLNGRYSGHMMDM